MKGEALFVTHSDTVTPTLEKITICHTGDQLKGHAKIISILKPSSHELLRNNLLPLITRDRLR